MTPPTGREKSLDSRLEIRISSELKDRLQKLADKDRRDVSEYIRLVLEDHVDRKRR